ncbi:MAG: stage II sporulation protein R [Clostridia bacterium]|nr:stage II sporulation protein R [Clostridia bacterium]
MNTKKLGLKSLTLCLVLCIAAVCFCDLVLIGKEAQVYDSLIRLHVIANSDSSPDQAVKLKVRDAILEAQIFGQAQSLKEAEMLSVSAASKAVAVANAVLEAEGMPYRASLRYGKEQYPTRNYGEIQLPAGTYRSLRIVLGEGEGKNWWCVLFPPLCNGGALSLDNSAARVFKTESPRYRFKFRLLELIFGG